FNTLLCYNALLVLDRNSVISLTRQFQNKTTVQFIASNQSLFRYLETRQGLDIIVKSILRLYGGIFDHPTKIDLSKVSEKASASQTSIINGLTQLERDEIIMLNLTKTDAQITFIEPREDDKTINRIAKIIKQQNQLKHNQV